VTLPKRTRSNHSHSIWRHLSTIKDSHSVNGVVDEFCELGIVPEYKKVQTLALKFRQGSIIIQNYIACPPWSPSNDPQYWYDADNPLWKNCIKTLHSNQLCDPPRNNCLTESERIKTVRLPKLYTRSNHETSSTCLVD